MVASQLHFLGTGTAFHTDGRSSQCLLARPASSPPFLVDLGPTAMAAMMRWQVATDELERLFVTHLHGDHVAGWPFLLLHLEFLDRRTRPFEVYGPRGVRACLEGLMSLCYPDVLEGPGLGFEVRYHEVAVASASGLKVGETSFDVEPMDHGLERLARSSDVLVVECTSVARVPHAHISLEEIREQIDRLGECEVVLIHLSDEVGAELAADPLPRVTASYDGMVYPL
jgi:ribonuclease BN (tRNA processing enzyme)